MTLAAVISRQAGRKHEARATGRTGDARDDAEHSREPIIGAVDRARDPTRSRAVPSLAAKDPIQLALSA